MLYFIKIGLLSDFSYIIYYVFRGKIVTLHPEIPHNALLRTGSLGFEAFVNS